MCIMLLKQQIEELKNKTFDEPQKVYSMYLNTDPRDPEQQNGKWKIKLKKSLQDLAETTKKSDSHEEKNQAKSMIEKVEQEVYDREPDMQCSFVFFGTADEELWFSKMLHIPVETELHWEYQSNVAQLEKLEEAYPYTGVVVMQQDSVLAIETEAGTILDKTLYTLDLNTDDWREHEGPQGDDLTQGGAKRDEFNERVKANQQRWYKSLASRLEKKGKKHGWKQMYLVGEKDELERIRPYFQKPIDKMVNKNILNWNVSHILAEALEDE